MKKSAQLGEMLGMEPDRLVISKGRLKWL